MATLTYSYADSTAVLGALSSVAEPHAYDLCAEHTGRLTVPRGWEVVRLPLREQDLNRHDDLLDIADALRTPVEPEPIRRTVGEAPPSRSATPRHRQPVQRHLRAVTESDE